jgi:hypothetical protein
MSNETLWQRCRGSCERIMSDVRYRIDPRLIAPQTVARRLGVTYECFKSVTPELEASGFPRPVSVLGNYCLQAVDNWIDMQSGLTPDTNPESVRQNLLAAVRGKRSA